MATDSPMMDLADERPRAARACVHRVAHAVTHVFNPLAMGIVSSALMTAKAIGGGSFVRWFPAMVLVTSVPPVLYVIYLVRTGYLRDFYMPDRSRRMKPILVIAAWIIVSAILLAAAGAPPIISGVMIAALVYTGALGVVTLRSKVSFHCATAATAAQTALHLASPLSWLLYLIVPVVAWARIALRRHTPGEVAGGIVAGLVLGRLAFWLSGYV